MPWVVDAELDGGLDASDSLGVAQAALRLKPASHVNAFAHIAMADSLGRRWVDPSGAVVVHSETWSQQADRYEENRSSGTQLRCRSDLVQKYLAANSAHLLILIVLRQYEPGFGDRSSRFRHTMAVVEVAESLAVVYHPGRTNLLDYED